MKSVARILATSAALMMMTALSMGCMAASDEQENEGEAADALTAVNVRLASYNTHLFRETVAVVSPSATFEDDTRMNTIINRLSTSGADVIGLSELWANDTKETFINGLKSVYPYAHWDHNTNPFEMGSGLLLLSKYPFLSTTFNTFNDLTGSDFFSQKGFLTAKININAKTLFVVLTHTQADANADAVAARASNLKQIVQKVQTLYSPGSSASIAIMGDLNVQAENGAGNPTSEYQSMLQIFAPLAVTDLYRTLNPSAASAHGYTYDGVHNRLIPKFAPDDTTNAVAQRLDYILYGKLTPVSVSLPISTYSYQRSSGTMDLSDHYPLTGVLTIP